MLRIVSAALLLICAGLHADEPAEPATPEQPSLPAAPESSASPVTEIMSKQVDSLYVVVLPMKGSYDQHQAAIGRLLSYLPDTLKVAPIGPPFGRYFNNPMEATEADLSWEVGMPVEPGTTPALPFEARTLPAGEVAYTTFTGPYENVSNAWPGVYMWAMSRGYAPAGPPMEIWMGGDGPQTELRLPISKPAPPSTAP